MTTPAFAPASLANQAVFRQVMNAFARPGEIQDMRTLDSVQALDDVPGISPAAAALLRTLSDYETPVWLDPLLRTSHEIVDWLRFETGAPLTADSAGAAFALLARHQEAPDFQDFSVGTSDYPDRSTTVILQIEEFAGPSFALAGPGIKGRRDMRARGLPPDFAARCALNRALFPRGIDMVLTCGNQLVALPRSTVVTEAA